MKILVIGDLHGQDDWKSIVTNNTFDKVVFLGDYFDSFFVKAKEQIKNFKELIQYKIDNTDKVVLLLGNHEYHYLKDVKATYSGYQVLESKSIRKLIECAIKKDYIKICYEYGKYLFTHAGITSTWLIDAGYVDENVSIYIHKLFKKNRLVFGYVISQSNIGDDISQGPLWVRPHSLRLDSIPGYIQVVGHTIVPQVEKFENRIWFVDTLQTSKECIIIDTETDGIQIIS